MRTSYCNREKYLSSAYLRIDLCHYIVKISELFQIFPTIIICLIWRLIFFIKLNTKLFHYIIGLIFKFERSNIIYRWNIFSNYTLKKNTRLFITALNKMQYVYTYAYFISRSKFGHRQFISFKIYRHINFRICIRLCKFRKRYKDVENENCSRIGLIRDLRIFHQFFTILCLFHHRTDIVKG